MRFQDHPVNSSDYKHAKELRRHASPYEQKLWFALRQSAKPKKLKFKRQQPIHTYVVDFICLEAKLVIELDGMSHDARQSYDEKRTEFLERQGYSVIRFANDEIKDNLSGIVETIILEAENLVRNSKQADI